MLVSSVNIKTVASNEVYRNVNRLPNLEKCNRHFLVSPCKNKEVPWKYDAKNGRYTDLGSRSLHVVSGGSLNWCQPVNLRWNVNTCTQNWSMTSPPHPPISSILLPTSAQTPGKSCHIFLSAGRIAVPGGKSSTAPHTQECLVLFEWVFFLHLRLWFIIKTASRTWVNKHITFDSSISQSRWKRHSWGWKPTLNTTWSWTSGVEIWITADHTGHWNRARASCFIHPPPCATLFLEQHQGYKLAQITVWGLLLCLLSDCEGCDQLSHSWADQASRGSQWVW